MVVLLSTIIFVTHEFMINLGFQSTIPMLDDVQIIKTLFLQKSHLSNFVVRGCLHAKYKVNKNSIYLRKNPSLKSVSFLYPMYEING